MILACLRGQGQVGTKERRAKLCDQLFLGIAFITPCLAPEFTIKTGFVLGPVG